jgi:hypothetical protein
VMISCLEVVAKTSLMGYGGGYAIHGTLVRCDLPSPCLLPLLCALLLLQSRFHRHPLPDLQHTPFIKVIHLYPHQHRHRSTIQTYRLTQLFGQSCSYRSRSGRHVEPCLPVPPASGGTGTLCRLRHWKKASRASQQVLRPARSSAGGAVGEDMMGLVGLGEMASMVKRRRGFHEGEGKKARSRICLGNRHIVNIESPWLYPSSLFMSSSQLEEPS